MEERRINRCCPAAKSHAVGGRRLPTTVGGANRAGWYVIARSCRKRPSTNLGMAAAVERRYTSSIVAHAHSLFVGMEFPLGFFSGRTTFLRFQVDGPSPGVFGPKHLERLSAFAFGNGRKTNAEGVDFGWIAGDHILDLDFDLAKNVVVDALRVSRPCLDAKMAHRTVLL